MIYVFISYKYHKISRLNFGRWDKLWILFLHSNQQLEVMQGRYPVLLNKLF